MSSAPGPLDTVWVLGDQLNRNIGPLAERNPGDCRVLLVISEAKIRSKRWHRQRLHLVLSAMTHFAEELRADGFEVDLRWAETLSAGLIEHCDEFEVERVLAMEPMSWDGRAMLESSGVDVVGNEQFFCHYEEFSEWASSRASFKMEDFYRWQRTRFDILVESDGSPVGGKWNFDHENREPPPKDGRGWPTFSLFERDQIDEQVLAKMAEQLGKDQLWGSGPSGMWPVTRSQALVRLNEFIEFGLQPFGPHEDAMLSDEWKLAHSALSSSMNLGLLHPTEVVAAAEDAYQQRDLPINSVEGFVRQVLGWREYVWGVYWLWMPSYREMNELDATRPVPPAFTGHASTDMNCVSSVIGHVEKNGYAHHIERLMVLGNLALTSGVDPQAMTDWMWASFVDGAEWVMVPNVVGMALHADGGQMATKPYASGGAYINKMSDFCKSCRFDPKKRTGESACPFTTLYWDFLARNQQSFATNHRLARQLGGMRRLKDLDDVRRHATTVLAALDAGDL